MTKLDLQFDREVVAPKLAATIVILRDIEEGGLDGFRVLCVRRSAGSAFLGGALVFPGGKVSADDGDALHEPNQAWRTAACRETLEEAAIALFRGAPHPITHEEAVLYQRELSSGVSYKDLLARLGVLPDLGALVPLSRWVTPVSEPRRFDTMFYLVAAPAGQLGQNDALETDASMWATPREILAAFARGEVALVPPTHRTLELLADFRSAEEAMNAARRAGEDALDPICPELVKQSDSRGDTLALVLPGDPAHSIREARIPGLSRYVLRGEQWLPEEAPSERDPARAFP